LHDSIFWITAAVFTLTYLGLAIGKAPGLRMDRAAIAFVGATLMLALGALRFREAFSPDSIDYATICLLFGMMVVVGFLRISGAFAVLIDASTRRIATPRALLAAALLIGGLLSAFLVNDVVCVALAPLVLHLARRLRCDPLPHLIALATAANIGSCATITGNPQNIIIGVQSGIPFARFALHLAPVALIGLALDYGVILLVCRKRLGRPQAQRTGNGGATVRKTGAAIAAPASRALPDAVTNADVSRSAAAKSATNPSATTNPVAPRERIFNHPVHRWLRRKSVAVALLAVIGFFIGLPIQLVALGAAAALLIGRINPRKALEQVDWGLLVMFAGLFIVVHAFQLRIVSHWQIQRWHWLIAHPVGRLSVVSAALSNLVSNVPAVLLIEPVVRAMPHAAQPTGWLALAMSSTLAGNLTLLGSVANLIVIERARREGVIISFWEYCKVGIPITILTLAAGVGYLAWVTF
jgi:Na+/H+ antiporter NhaD/arsenite permease-like protein